jgi:hypothetical protein
MRLKLIIFAVFTLALVNSWQGAFASFPDTTQHQWFDSIEYLQDFGIIGGYPDGTFQPDRTINRAEFTKIIIAAAFEPPYGPGKDCFLDVNQTDWFSPYVCLAKDEGILNGYPDGSFRPTQEITQPEALKIIFNAFQEPIENQAGEWYEQYLGQAEWMGMLYFEPKNAALHKMTRAEMSYFTAWLISEDLPDQIDPDQFYNEVPDAALADFEFEKLTADDCYEDEYYDHETQYCYLELECETEVECLALEEQWYAENEEYYEESDVQFQHKDLDQDEGESISRYRIEANTISLLSHNPQVNADLAAYQSQTEQHQVIWESFARLIPAHARGMISEFVIFSDGKDGILAAVAPLESDPTKWELLIDIQDSFENGKLETRELPHTLVHEFGHVLTLSADQVTPLPFAETDEEFTAQQQNCFPNHMLNEGCSKANAYINLFFKQYWRNFVEEWASILELEDPLAQEDKVFELYEKYRDRFVSDYAATNLGEDIAESWTAFIMKTKPTGSTIADQKTQFFYQFPALIELRKQIAQRLQIERSR